MYIVYHQKSISALRLTAGKVEQQVGLLLSENCSKATEPLQRFCGVSLQAVVLYSCAGRKYRELQDGIVKVRFRKKVESQVMI